MKWLESLKRKLGPENPETPDPNDSLESQQILENARAALGEARERSVTVKQVAGDLDRIRKRNHFGESFELAMTRRH